jgi:nitrogen fixation NifU-like protein
MMKMRRDYGPYSKQVMKHFIHPHNLGRIKNPDGVGKVGNVICGDVMWLYIKVKKDKRGRRIINDVKFQTFGCVVAIATSSIITDLAKGKTIEEAIKLTKDKIIKGLGGKLPPIKIHCSVLAVDALNEAIYDYLTKNNLPLPKGLLKRHEKIQKTLKVAEERHKKYLEFERKVLKKR